MVSEKEESIEMEELLDDFVTFYAAGRVLFLQRIIVHNVHTCSKLFRSGDH